MSELSNRDREERALESLIVSQLRRERNPNNDADLPELTDDERTAMNALPTDFAKQIWLKASLDEQKGEIVFDLPVYEVANDFAFAGMNRADEVDEETRINLERRRQEILERLKAKKEASKRQDKDGRPQC